MLPNFLIVGGQRCATGWISQCLREHPDVFMAPDETRFFDWNFEEGTEWWRERYFYRLREQKAIGEKTANYLTDALAPQRIFNTLPKVKILCCLRNPVERLQSAFMMKACENPRLKDFSLEELIRVEPDLVERGRYSKYLQQYYQLFPGKRILVLIYDDKQKDPHHFIKTIYNFLDLDSSFIPGSLNIQTKPGAAENNYKFLSRFSRAILHRHSPLRKLYSFFRPDASSSLWTANDLQFLGRIYKAEIQKLEILIGRKLPEWQE